MRLAVFQATPRPRDVAGNLARLAARLVDASEAGAELLVTPEMYLTGYNIGAADVRALAEPSDGPSCAAVAALASEHGVAVLYGYPELVGEDVFNAVRLVGADGTPLANYRKSHLFGELDRTQFVAADDRSAVVELAGWRVGMLICYDVVFPENVRRLALAGADLVLVPTANMVPYDIVATTVVPTRAYENQVYLVYANYTGSERELAYCGLSCVVGPDGGDAARAGRGEELLLAEIDPVALAMSRRGTPYLADRRPGLYQDLTAENPTDV